jgi:histone H3
MPRQKIAGKKQNKNSAASKASVATGSNAIKAQAKKKTVPAEGGIKAKRRFRPGTVALREIKRYQKATTFMLAKAPFQRFIRAICDGIDGQLRF